MRTQLMICALLATVALAGCVGDDEADVPAIPADAPVREYLHDVSQPVGGFSIDTALIENYRTLIDETLELDTWIVRPDTDEPVGTVLEVTPYYGGGNPILTRQLSLGLHASELVSRGFAFGISSVRGTGNSEGCFTQGGPSEGTDTAAVVQDIASQPWSNGNVGIMGVSYPGTTPQDVWIEAPPALKTIVPISGISDLYKYNFVNGVHINPQGYAFNTYYWAIVGLGPAGLAGGVQPSDPLHVPGAVAGEACQDQIDVQEGGASSAIDGNKDRYWQVRDFHAELVARPDEDRAAVFYIHGLQDWNVKPHMMEDWITAIQDTGVPFKAWLGQWGHAWPAPTGGPCDEPGSACRADWWTEVMIAWFDQFLNERDTGILDAPAVQVQDDDGIWHHEPQWPPQDVEWRHFALADGALVQDGEPAGSASYHDYFGQYAAQDGLPTVLGTEQAIWVSEPFADDVHISGMPHFIANVTADGQYANLILTLAERTSEGDRSFNFCAQSLNHVDSLEAGHDDVSGMAQEVHVDCFPQDDVVHAGNSLVLIASGNTVGGPAPGFTPRTFGSMITIEDGGIWLPIDHSIVVEAVQPYAS